MSALAATKLASKGVALVTGAANGIGRAISLRLASDGYDVAMNDLPRHESKLEELRREIKERYPGREGHAVVVGDVSVENDVKGMVEGVVGRMKGLDVMVANAGIIIVNPITKYTLEEWEKTFAVNVRGTFLCYKYAGLSMIASGKKGGRIIGASSIAGKQGYQLASAYAASKFAIRGLTQSAAAEFGPYGITVNAYAPGGIENTTMLPSMDLKLEQLTGGKPEASFTNSLKNASVLGHNGQPEDVAAVVSFLASPEANFITGQSVSCNGGAFFD